TNTVGADNTASGQAALSNNLDGSANTANGVEALFSNTSGDENTANGFQALHENTTGNDNAANGLSALLSNTTGCDNTANGAYALRNNTTGSYNIAIGNQAGDNLTTGDNNIDIGNFNSNPPFGSSDVAGESNTIRIGTPAIHTATLIAGISGAPVAGVTVVVDGNGQLGVLVSSKTFKDEIKPMDKLSESILSLQPVTFRYKKEIDSKSTPQFGLIAEEVEKVNADL